MSLFDTYGEKETDMDKDLEDCFEIHMPEEYKPTVNEGRNRIEELEMSEWQTIESAPRDGTCVLLYGYWAGEISGPTNNLSIDIGSWNGGKSDYDGFDWWYLSTGDAYACWMRATHWMQLPPLPIPPSHT